MYFKNYNLFLMNKFYYQLALSRQVKFIQAKNILQCFVEWIDIPINKFHHFCAEKEGLSYAENELGINNGLLWDQVLRGNKVGGGLVS